MRRTVVMVAVLLQAAAAQAQNVPGTYSFTARISDTAGPLDGSHTIVLRLFDVSSGGAALWEETHSGVNVDQGLVNLAMGSQNVIEADLLEDASLFVEVAVDGTTLGPRLALRSVPFSSRAGDAVRLRGLAPSAFATASHNHDSAYVNAGGDTMSGALGLSGDFNMYGRHALRGSDSWLRLNQDGAFTSGTHTPGNFNANGVTVGALFYNPGGGNLHVANVITMGSNAGDCPVGWFCNGMFWDISSASMFANEFRLRSDRRLKKNIQPVATGLDAVLALRPVTYEWRDERKPGTRYGFVAQEVEQVIPALVTETDKGMKALDTIGLVPVTVNAIKELKAENDALRSDLAQLRDEIEAIKAGRPLPPQTASARSPWIKVAGFGGGAALVIMLGAGASIARRRRRA